MDNKIYTYVNGEEGKLPYENAHLVLPLDRMEEVCGFKPMQVAPKYLRITRIVESLYGKMQWWMIVARQDHEGNVGIDYVRKAPMDEPTYSYADIALDHTCDTLKEVYEYFKGYMSRFRFDKIAGLVRKKTEMAGGDKKCLIANVKDACVEYLEERERHAAEREIKRIANEYGLQSVTERYWRFEEKKRTCGWDFLAPAFYL